MLGITGPVIQPLLHFRLTRPLRKLAHPLVALLLWALNIYGWHLPAAYNATLTSEVIHQLEHAMFFFFGLLFWARVVDPGPLRPRLRMRLNVDRWSWLPARTALELIPCERVRPTAAYFRSGHLLLDSLTHSMSRHAPTQRFDQVSASQPSAPGQLHRHTSPPR